MGRVGIPFNPSPQFSRLGTWCPTLLLCATVLFVSVYVLGWRMGVEGDFYSLWLVCYKYTFHGFESHLGQL